MFYNILKAYKEFGYEVHIGNTNLFPAAISKNGDFLITGGGINISDIAFFNGLERIYKPKNIFVIGNAFGYSTLVLATIFPNAIIDVIDGGEEGEFNNQGNILTQNICDKYFPNVKITSGFSPEDLSSAVRVPKYDFIFIDGWHSNEQQMEDYLVMLNYASDSCVMYLHDVEFCKMQEGYKEIKKICCKDNFKPYNIDFSIVGCKALVRNLPEVESWFQFLDRTPIKELPPPPGIIHLAVVQDPATLVIP